MYVHSKLPGSSPVAGGRNAARQPLPRAPCAPSTVMLRYPQPNPPHARESELFSAPRRPRTMPPRPVHNPNATRISRTALAAEAAVAASAAVRLAPESAPRAAPANATRLQPDVAAAVCAPAPAQVCFAGIPGSFERGLFVHSYPARVCLIVANDRLRISFVGDDRCRFVCRSSNANWRPSSCALRCIVRASLGAVG